MNSDDFGLIFLSGYLIYMNSEALMVILSH